MKYLLSIITFFFLFYSSAFAQSNDSATNQAVVTIKASISITAVDQLRFSDASPNDLAETVTSASTEAASFNISGEDNSFYSITLPTTIDMITAGGGTPQTEIEVNTFEHDKGVTPQLDGSGLDTVKVGATRAAILSDQTSGIYSGNFDVAVNY
jgi:hypothetical protein